MTSRATLAGMLLVVLHYGGAAMAIVAAGAALALGRTGWLVWLPIVLAVACLASEGLLAPAIAAVRPSTLGALVTEETSRQFGLLHAVSLGLFMLIHAFSIVLLVAHARRDGNEAAANE